MMKNILIQFGAAVAAAAAIIAVGNILSSHSLCTGYVRAAHN